MTHFENAPSGAMASLCLETKSIDNGSEVADAFGDFMHAFEDFKSANDDRLAQLETRMGSDVITVEKVDRINAALDDQKRALDALVTKGLRPHLGGETRRQAAPEHHAAFDAYVRKGDERGMMRIEEKAYNITAGADGGFLVPPEVATEIGRRLAKISPIRSIATVRQVSASVLKKPFSLTGPATGWVAETAVRPQTNSGTLSEMQFPTMELYAMPAATTALLDDGIVDMDSWIAAEVETAFAEQESQAFVTGDGINKPRGFLDYPNVAESAWSWGSIGQISTGVSAGFPASNPSDILVELMYALKSGYRQNASWVMSRQTQSAIRKLKDTTGNYLWSPPAAIGERAMLMGFQLVEAEHMPDIAANAKAVAFGDFQRGYLVVDRVGIRILRDPYSAKPYVLFYTTKRVGGGVQDFDAIKVLKFGV
jgi:HK97 family phage major capsid protein